MKKIFFIVVILLIQIIHAGYAQSSTKGLARVSKMQGIEVYAMCEPLREYETLFDVVTGAKAASLLTGGLVNEGVSDKLSQFVSRAIKEADKRKQTIDAIIYTDGKKIIAVKFTGKSTSANKSIARVSKLEGKEVYVMNEPLKDYETTVDVNTGVKAKSYITGGIVNNSIEEDMAQYVRRAVKEAEETNKKVDAIVYTGGKRAIGVTFAHSK
jgi:ribosomal protein L25 (general stress protein Ctc)